MGPPFQVFNQIQRKWQQKEHMARMELINSVKMLQDLDMHQRELLSDALERVEFKAGDVSPSAPPRLAASPDDCFFSSPFQLWGSP